MIQAVGSLPVGAVFGLSEERTRISSIEGCPSHPATHVLVNAADCWPRGALVDVVKPATAVADFAEDVLGIRLMPWQREFLNAAVDGEAA